LTQLSKKQCLGAFFELETGTSAPSWIVGDTFLKNVYSVFRYDPPSIGFAKLSAVADSFSNLNSLPPTPTIGSVATVAATQGSGANRNISGAVGGRVPSSLLGVAVTLSVLVSTFFWAL
jgi:cathepsin D